MGFHKCSACMSCIPWKKQKRVNSVLWTSYEIAMTRAGKIATETDLLCASCHIHLKSSFDRSTVLDLKKLITKVERKKPKFIPSLHVSSSNSTNQDSVPVEMDVDHTPTSNAHSSQNLLMDSEISLYPESTQSQRTSSCNSAPQAMELDEIGNYTLGSVPPSSQFHLHTDSKLSLYSEPNSLASSSVASGAQRVPQTSHIFVPGIPSVKYSENRCFVCHEAVRNRTPVEIIWDVYVKSGILVPLNNRCCRDHIDNNELKSSALLLLQPCDESCRLTGKQVAILLKKIREILKLKKNPIDFSESSRISDSSYDVLLGVEKTHFEELHLHVCDRLRNSSNRDTRNALAMLLIKLRLNVSQRVIAFLFGVSSQSIVSRTIRSVLRALEQEFVPRNIGFHHISREDLLQKHMRKFFTTVLELNEEDLILALDGTYLYTQKSTDFSIQRRTWSVQKKRNLFKPMMVVCPDGYILEAKGLYFSDGGNNDANILKSMLKDEDDSILSILQERDALLVDRGFLHVIKNVNDTGVSTFMPTFLKKGQKQFTTMEANLSRQVTFLRWVVESANGRLKNRFKFFESVIPTTYFKILNSLMRTTIAIINCFSGPLFNETSFHDDIIPLILERLGKENELQKRVEEENLAARSANWTRADQDCLLEFPLLSLEELKRITLGCYQLKIGLLYNEHHLRVGRDYEFSVHDESPGLIRIRLQSRFRKRQSHLLWISFIENGTGPESITDWYCKCKSGARTLGCCAHVADVLRHLSHDRFEVLRQREDISSQFLDAAALLAEESDEDEESEEEEESEDEEEED